jgi:hypothetical protein
MLAEVIGTIRSRVSHFTNKFRELGFIEYQAGEELRVHSSLLNIVLLDFVPKRKRTPPRIRITKDVPVRRIDHISIKVGKNVWLAFFTPVIVFFVIALALSYLMTVCWRLWKSN